MDGRPDRTGTLASGELHDLWIYVAGPIAGAIVGALAYQLVRGRQPGEPEPEAEIA